MVRRHDRVSRGLWLLLRAVRLLYFTWVCWRDPPPDKPSTIWARAEAQRPGAETSWALFTPDRPALFPDGILASSWDTRVWGKVGSP
jgi:hypothetical protein